MYNNNLLRVSLYDDLGNLVKETPGTKKTEADRPFEDTLVLKSFGDNKYKIDLARYHLVSGFYNIKVWDVDNKLYYLKFLIQD